MNTLNVESFARLVTQSQPQAVAFLHGNDASPATSGLIRFYPAAKGTLVVSELFGLPHRISVNREEKMCGPFYALHIHEGSECGSGAEQDPFAQSGSHYNPGGKPHPFHAGDLPPVLSDDGYGYQAVYTSRFAPGEITGKTVILHQGADDFHSQPSGNAGIKLACGRIQRVHRI